jgi:hypothetical protein
VCKYRRIISNITVNEEQVLITSVRVSNWKEFFQGVPTSFRTIQERRMVRSWKKPFRIESVVRYHGCELRQNTGMSVVKHLPVHPRALVL